MIKIKTNTGKNQYKKKSKDYSKYDACFKLAGNLFKINQKLILKYSGCGSSFADT